jgi:putative DNA primase/helicase
LNVQNGTIDLRLGTLHPHNPADLLTKISPVKYDATATCPRFEQFISEILSADADLITFMKRHLGYCLTGDVTEHMLAFWYGRTGGNGKSTLAGLLFYLLGDYAQKAAPDLLFRSEKTDRHPTELADLFGARLVVCNETSRSRVWDEPTVKDITGGDPITARRMREDFWSFTPTHKLVVFGNNKPKIVDTEDGGMLRRLRLVPFEVTFTGAPDKRLLETLKKEGPGILAYLVRACLDWQKDGLTDPASVTKATATYFSEEDTIGRFMSECCELGAKLHVSSRALLNANASWSNDVGEKPATAKALALWLNGHGAKQASVKVADRQCRGWKGLRLLDDTSTEAAQCDLPS